MNKSVEKRLQQEMKKEQELPQSVRIAFDQSYEQIRQLSKKKTKTAWFKPVAAAVATIVLASGIMLTNDTVLAKLQTFFSLKDPGIDLASDYGDVQYLAQSQQSEDITITLEHFFVDAYRLAIQLNIESEHIQMDDLHDMHVEYRLYNIEGQEIDTLVSDTKPIAGRGIFTGAQFKLENVKKHAATLEMLTVSNRVAVPSLDGAKLVIETIHFLNKDGSIISVDGKWAFDLTSPPVETQVFVGGNIVPGLELQQAALTNGSMQISYKVDQQIENENDIFKTALVNDNGESFYANSANVEYLEEEQQTIISLVFPYSIWNEQQTLSLAVKGYEKLRLVEKE
ncbi:DUF4179 domain-containing protein [Metasolibacillus meyeri]|uniref:DUF4179 domain-containing protein n=1 Tax=Metasolibacillus meyeri TaxID=1071052 RepID=UPI000D2FD231|nr:DUF4179 domain-containing protein [Metasolibacillus meyeri]